MIVSSSKSEVMVINKKAPPGLGESLPQAEEFQHFWILLVSINRTKQEMDRRIKAFCAVTSVLLCSGYGKEGCCSIVKTWTN